MPGPVDFGIISHAGSLIDSVTVKTKVDEHVLKGSNGEDAVVSANNTTTDFDVSGHGDLTMTPGITGAQLDNVTESGVTVVKELTEEEKNDGFTSWKYSGTNHPNATTA